MNILPLCSHGSQRPFGRVACVICVSPCNAPGYCARECEWAVLAHSAGDAACSLKTLHLSSHNVFRAVAPFVPPLFTAVRSRRAGGKMWFDGSYYEEETARYVNKWHVACSLFVFRERSFLGLQCRWFETISPSRCWLTKLIILNFKGSYFFLARPQESSFSPKIIKHFQESFSSYQAKV